ncbi:MAG: PDZ domain-containing protein [Candidatus Eisenbacteria sp.]|nr:PDZ domain-containing protein [Candidatus Eisenbacteria bacterium]
MWRTADLTAVMILVGFLLLIPCVPVSSRAEWREDLTTLIEARDTATTDDLMEKILKAAPSWEEAAAAIKAIAFPVPEQTGKAILDSIACLDGVTRPYVTYVPSHYDPSVPSPLLVCLHGGVGRKEIIDDPVEYAEQSPFLAYADEQSWLVLVPMGQNEATWWDNVGMENILNQVRHTKRHFNVDDDRVWMMGFSDGASGGFAFAMIKPSDFAAFVPLNGHMGVANRHGQMETYAANMANTPLHVINTDLDGLYPADRARKMIAMALQAGANIMYREYHGIGHEPTYASQENPRIARFLENHPREPLPPKIHWKSASKEYGLCRWFCIDKVLPVEAAPWHTDANLIVVDDRVTFGFYHDESYEGYGTKVSKLVDGETLARRMGLAEGDVITRCGNMQIGSIEDLSAFKRRVKRGDHVQVTVKRSGEKVQLEGNLPEISNRFLFERGAPCAAVRVRFLANRVCIEGSRLGGFTILVHPDMVQLEQELVVEINGSVAFAGKVEPDLEFMLRNFLANRDRKLLYVAQVNIE